jgi:hypothetical protein
VKEDTEVRTAPSLSDTRKAVDGEDYAEALAIARALGPDDLAPLRRAWEVLVASAARRGTNGRLL